MSEANVIRVNLRGFAGNVGAKMLAVFSAANEKGGMYVWVFSGSHPGTIREASLMMTNYIKEDSRNTKRNRILWDLSELQDQALPKATLEFSGT